MTILVVSIGFLLLISVKYKIVRSALVIGLLSIFITIVLYRFAETRFFKVYVYPESFALEDFDPLDIAFQKRAKPEIDDRIVLVNIGNLSRSDIARQIEIITQASPRVLAVDALFNCPKGVRNSENCPQSLDTVANQRLSDAIRKAGHVILGSILQQSDSLSNHFSYGIRYFWEDGFDEPMPFDSMEISDDMFSNHALTGFSTFPVASSKPIFMVRTFFPMRMVKGKEQLHIGVKMALLYDSLKARKFLARNHDEEYINFRGNIQHDSTIQSDAPAYRPMFKSFDTQEVLDGRVNPSMFKDKIVIMGFLGDYIGAPSIGKSTTPLNPYIGGRTNPDMFGTVVVANIAAMILNEDYIDEASTLDEFTIAFLASFLHIMLLLLILRQWQVWYDVLAAGLVILQLGIYSWLRINLFVHYNIKVSFVASIATLAIASIAVSAHRELIPHMLSKFRKKSKAPAASHSGDESSG